MKKEKSLKLVSSETIKRVVGYNWVSRIQREIDAIGSVPILMFKATSVEEFFSVFALLTGVSVLLIFLGIYLNKVGLFLVLAVAVPAFGYLTYKDPVDKYKNRLMQDNELPTVIQTFISGLDVGMPVESVMKYIVDNKKGITRDIINDSLNKINVGIPLEESLKEAADRSMNKYFKRAVRILSKSDETVSGLALQLNELLQDIEDERINKKTEKAGMLENTIAFPVLIGYIVPLLIVMIFPLIASVSGMLK